MAFDNAYKNHLIIVIIIQSSMHSIQRLTNYSKRATQHLP